MVVFVALDETEHQVPDVEGLTPHSMAVVPAQRLLVLGRAEEGNVTCFILPASSSRFALPLGQSKTTLTASSPEVWLVAMSRSSLVVHGPLRPSL